MELVGLGVHLSEAMLLVPAAVLVRRSCLLDLQRIYYKNTKGECRQIVLGIFHLRGYCVE
jgi:hypothetical protein